MAKKKTKQQPTEAEPEPAPSTEEVINEEEGVEEMELLSIDVGDSVKVKQVLDEGVSSALLDYVGEE